MLSEEEYIELVNALIDEGFSEDEGLFDPPHYKLS